MNDVGFVEWENRLAKSSPEELENYIDNQWAKLGKKEPYFNLLLTIANIYDSALKAREPINSEIQNTTNLKRLLLLSQDENPHVYFGLPLMPLMAQYLFHNANQKNLFYPSGMNEFSEHLADILKTNPGNKRLAYLVCTLFAGINFPKNYPLHKDAVLIEVRKSENDEMYELDIIVFDPMPMSRQRHINFDNVLKIAKCQDVWEDHIPGTFSPANPGWNAAELVFGAALKAIPKEGYRVNFYHNKVFLQMGPGDEAFSLISADEFLKNPEFIKQCRKSNDRKVAENITLTDITYLPSNIMKGIQYFQTEDGRMNSLVKLMQNIDAVKEYEEFISQDEKRPFYKYRKKMELEESVFAESLKFYLNENKADPITSGTVIENHYILLKFFKGLILSVQAWLKNPNETEKYIQSKLV